MHRGLWASARTGFSIGARKALETRVDRYVLCVNLTVKRMQLGLARGGWGKKMVLQPTVGDSRYPTIQFHKSMSIMIIVIMIDCRFSPHANIPVVDTYSFSVKEMAYSQHPRLPEIELLVLEEYVKAIDDKKEIKRTSRSLAMPVTQSSRRKNDFSLGGLVWTVASTARKCWRCYPETPPPTPLLTKIRKNNNFQTRRTRSPASAYPLAFKRSNSRDRCRGHHVRGPYVSRLRSESQ